MNRDCPGCGSSMGISLDMLARNVGLPKEPSPVICVECRAVLALEPSGHLRHPTMAEEDDFLASTAVQYSIATLAQYHQEHGPRKQP